MNTKPYHTPCSFPARRARTCQWWLTGIVVLGLFPGALCYTLWSFVLSHWPLSRLASWMFLIPLVAVLLGWLILAELPRSSDLIGGLITILGVAIVNTRRR